ncbi:MAG TPA: sigma-70 family RNA polymerase sigma factor, partial [Urbifossiella sp.]|nr:sigma-70 family RNA polymerase sigma factor [Urbifossiella sp.]
PGTGIGSGPPIGACQGCIHNRSCKEITYNPPPSRSPQVNIVDARATDFSHLVERLHSGDPEVLSRLYASYGGVVREAVRRRLPDRLRKEYDSLDFAQDVWASFCRIPPGKHHFTTPQDLGGFLTRLAYNKVIDVCRRRLGTQGYDVGREQPMVRAADGAEVPVPGRDATPSQCAIADEKWAGIAAALPASHLAVVELLREGFTQKEVAAMAGITDRTVRRIVDRVREICEDGP